MPNPKLETYKNKATGTVYDFTDADAQSKVTATVDLLKDTTGWVGGNELPPDIIHLATSGSGIGETTLTTDASATAFVGELKSNTDYIIKAEGGNRFRVALATTAPANGTSVNIVYDNAGNRIYEFNSGSYSYIYLLADYQGSGTVDTIKPMVITSEQYALNPSYEPYHASVDEVKADKTEVQTSISLLSDTVGWKGKNKLKNTASSSTISSIPFVRNSDETWKVGAGTASADVWNNISGTFRLPEGKYRLTGCPESGSGYTYFLYLRNNPQSAGDISVSDAGNGVEFTVTSELAQKDLVLFIAVKNGTTISNPVIFKPMICTVEQYDLSPTYEPYHKSVEEMLTPIIYNTYKAISSGIVSEGVIVRAVRNIAGIQINVEFTVGNTDITSWTNLIQFEPELKSGISMRDTVVPIRDVTDETLSAIKLVTITQDNWLASNNTFKANHKYQFCFIYLS